jgi:hypothetical protein
MMSRRSHPRRRSSAPSIDATVEASGLRRRTARVATADESVDPEIHASKARDRGIATVNCMPYPSAALT